MEPARFELDASRAPIVANSVVRDRDLNTQCSDAMLPSVNILRLASALLAGCLTWPAFGADPTLWQVGTARTVITPDRPLWLAGYASRDKPAQGKTMDLWLKMLALEDAHGHRALLMTSDLLGVPQSIYQHSWPGA